MNRCTTMLLSVLMSAGAAHALLINGDLDDPPVTGSNLATGWTLVEPDQTTGGGAVDSAHFANFANHTPGGGRGLWYRPFEGGLEPTSPDTVNADLFQDVPGVAGVEYTLSAWFLMEVGYSGLDELEPTQTILALEFRDGNGLLDSVELDVDTVYDDSPGNVSTFQQFEVVGTAPAGTTIVRVRTSMVDGLLQPTNPQTAFVDDFVLAGPLGILFDVDGDGMALPLTDGILIVRYLFGFTGAALINGAVGTGCTRCSFAQIEAYLEGPVN